MVANSSLLAFPGPSISAPNRNSFLVCNTGDLLSAFAVSSASCALAPILKADATVEFSKLIPNTEREALALVGRLFGEAKDIAPQENTFFELCKKDWAMLRTDHKKSVCGQVDSAFKIEVDSVPVSPSTSMPLGSLYFYNKQNGQVLNLHRSAANRVVIEAGLSDHENLTLGIVEIHAGEKIVISPRALGFFFKFKNSSVLNSLRKYFGLPSGKEVEPMIRSLASAVYFSNQYPNMASSSLIFYDDGGAKRILTPKSGNFSPISVNHFPKTPWNLYTTLKCFGVRPFTPLMDASEEALFSIYNNPLSGMMTLCLRWNPIKRPYMLLAPELEGIRSLLENEIRTSLPV